MVGMGGAKIMMGHKIRESDGISVLLNAHRSLLITIESLPLLNHFPLAAKLASTSTRDIWKNITIL